MKLIQGKEYTTKGSKFYGFYADINSVEQFKFMLDEVKKLYKKATHYCYAYIINESENVDQLSFVDNSIRKEKYSNDGEPSGVGSAMLSILKHDNLENCAIIVVRYFGGTLLGVGGMIRAYVESTKLAIEKARK